MSAKSSGTQFADVEGTEDPGALHARPRVQRACGIPCALLIQGRTFTAKLARRRSEVAMLCLRITLLFEN